MGSLVLEVMIPELDRMQHCFEGALEEEWQRQSLYLEVEAEALAWLQVSSVRCPSADGVGRVLTRRNWLWHNGYEMGTTTHVAIQEMS